MPRVPTRVKYSAKSQMAPIREPSEAKKQHPCKDGEQPSAPYDAKAAGKTQQKIDADIYRVLIARRKRAEQDMKAWLDAGLKLEEFINSMADPANVASMFSSENGWIRSKVNKMAPLQEGILANIAFKNPQVMAFPLRRGDEWVGTANVESTYFNRCIEEAVFDKHQRFAATDCIIYGAGFIEEGKDADKEGIPTAIHRRVMDVLVDTQAHTPEQMTWYAVRETVPVRKARKMFGYDKLISDAEALKNAAKDSSGKQAGTDTKTPDVPLEPEDEPTTLWRFMLLRDSCDFGTLQSAPQGYGGKGKDESDFEKMLREDGNRMIVISEHCPGIILSNKPWPFILDKNALPLTILTLSDKPGRLLPPSPLVTVRDQQQVLNNVYTFLVTQAFTNARIKYVGDKQQIAQDESILKKITSPVVGDVIGVDGGALNFKALEVSKGGDQFMMQLFQFTNQLFDEISGFREMFGGMEGDRSAAQSIIKEGRASTLSDSQRAVFERGVRDVLRKMAQIGYSTSTARLVSRWVGYEEMGWTPKNQADEGKPIEQLGPEELISKYWDDDKKPEDIRRECNIMLVPGSTRRVNKDKEIGDLQGVMVMVRDLLMLYQQNGYRINQDVLAKRMNYLLGRVLRSIGLYDYKQIEITSADLNLEPSLLGKDMSAGVQAKIASMEGIQKGREEQGALNTEQDAANAEAVAELFMAQGMPENQARTAASKMNAQQRALMIQMIEGGMFQGGPGASPPTQ